LLSISCLTPPSTPPCFLLMWRVPQPNSSASAPTGTRGGSGLDKEVGNAPRTLADAQALVASQAGEEMAKGKGKGSMDTMELALQVIDQLEARLRVLEGISLTRLKLPSDNGAVVAGPKGAEAYAAAVNNNPEHQYGSPSTHIFLSFLAGLLNGDLPAGADGGLKGRFAVCLLLKHLMASQDLQGVQEWVKQFRVAPMLTKPGKAEHARVVMHLEGSVAIPSGEAAGALFDQVKAALGDTAAESAAVEMLNQLASQYIIMWEDVPSPSAASKAVTVTKLVSSLVCSMGATKFQRNPPRTGLAYELSRKAGRPGAAASTTAPD